MHLVHCCNSPNAYKDAFSTTFASGNEIILSGSLWVKVCVCADLLVTSLMEVVVKHVYGGKLRSLKLDIINGY